MVDSLRIPGGEVLIRHRTGSVTWPSSVERHSPIDECAHPFTDVPEGDGHDLVGQPGTQQVGRLPRKGTCAR